MGVVSDDRLGGLGHCVLADLPRQEKTHSSLDVSTRDGAVLVGVGQENSSMEAASCPAWTNRWGKPSAAPESGN